MKKKLDEILKEFKAKHGLTTEELSVVLEVGTSMTSKYLSGTFPGDERKTLNFKKKMDSWEKRQSIEETILAEGNAEYANKEHYMIPYNELSYSKK